MTRTTKIVAEALSEKDPSKATVIREAVGEGLRGGGRPSVDWTDVDRRLVGFLEAKRIAPDRDTVALWGRNSGKTGGLHPEGDASTTGLIQIAGACSEQGWQVVIAGAVNPAKRDRFGEAILIGEFWNNNDEWPFANDRTKQVRLFGILLRYLRTRNAGLVHVGMRSGGLDAYGFAGQATIYIYPRLTREATGA